MVCSHIRPPQLKTINIRHSRPKPRYLKSMDASLEEILGARFLKDRMIGFLQANPSQVAVAIQLAKGDKKPIAWRAAWAANHCTTKNDPLLRPHIDDFIACLPNKEPGHKRELLRLLEKMVLDEEQEGKLFDLCLTFWESVGLQPAIRMIAIRIVLQVAEKYPELRSEIKYLTQEEYLEPLSPGVKQGVIKLLNQYFNGHSA